MKGKLSKFIESIAVGLAKDALKGILIFAFTSGICGFISHFVSANISLLAKYSIWLGLIFASGGGLISLYIYSRCNKFIPKFRKMDFQYIVINKEYSYEYTDLTNMIYKKSIQLKALANNLDRYHDRFCWSGCGKITPKCENKEYQYIPTARRGAYQEYDILFDKKLKKGETIDISITFDLEDISGTSDPHMSTTISAPTDYLILRIIIPAKFNVKKAIAEILPNSDYYNPLYTEIINFVYNEKYGEAKWEITMPKLLHIYSIRWKF